MKRCLSCMQEFNQNNTVCPHCGRAVIPEVEEMIHLFPGSIIFERYLIGRELDYEGFGVSYIAWDQLLQQRVTIKEYLPTEFCTRVPGTTAVTILQGGA